jgi:hypothetical protein
MKGNPFMPEAFYITPSDGIRKQFGCATKVTLATG